MAGPIDNDARIMQLAAPKGGVCTRAELVAHGVTPGAIDQRVRRQLLEPVCRGVYLIAALVTSWTPLYRAVAALPRAVISHLTAGRIQEFPVEPPGDSDPVHVLVENGTNRRLDGVVLHRVRRLPDAADVVMLNGLPVTGPARTVVDLAAVVGPNRLRHIIETQVRDDNPSSADLIACFERVARQGVPGSGELRRQLHLLFGERPVTRSALEGALWRLMEANGIVGFESQFRPPWYDGLRGVVDFAHPGRRMVVEADGRRWHSREQEMAEDRRRDRLAARHGWVTMRFTWAEIQGRPTAVASELRAVVAARAVAAA